MSATPKRSTPMKTVLLSCVVSLSILLAPAGASAMTSHDGWPEINGMLLMNKLDQDRPLDGRPGHDPFDGKDSSYSCDGLHQNSSCVRGSYHVFGEGCDEAPSRQQRPRRPRRPRDDDVIDEESYDETDMEMPLAMTARSRGCDSSGASNRVPANIGHNE